MARRRVVGREDLIVRVQRGGARPPWRADPCIPLWDAINRVPYYFLCLYINRGAQSDHCLHFVEAMTVAVDPSLAAVEVADSIPTAEVAALERKADTAVDPSPAAPVVAGSSPVAVAVRTADSIPDFPVVADSSLAVGIAAADSSFAVLVAVGATSAGQR